MGVRVISIILGYNGGHPKPFLMKRGSSYSTGGTHQIPPASPPPTYPIKNERALKL